MKKPMKKSMRDVVKEGYEKGNFIGEFRASSSSRNIIPNEKSLIDKLISLLPKKPNILDFGCGNGLPYDKYLVEHNCIVTGIDITEKHLVEARLNIPEGRFINEDFSEYKTNEKYDAIVSFYAIFHIPREEHLALFKKMYELLGMNGKILITLGRYDDEGGVWDFCGSKMSWSSFSADKNIELLNEAGFNILDSYLEGKPGDNEQHLWVLATK